MHLSYRHQKKGVIHEAFMYSWPLQIQPCSTTYMDWNLYENGKRQTLSPSIIIFSHSF